MDNDNIKALFTVLVNLKKIADKYKDLSEQLNGVSNSLDTSIEATYACIDFASRLLAKIYGINVDLIDEYLYTNNCGDNKIDNIGCIDDFLERYGR